MNSADLLRWAAATLHLPNPSDEPLSQRMVKDAFHALALKLHPDKCNGSSHDESSPSPSSPTTPFVDVRRAYEILMRRLTHVTAKVGHAAADGSANVTAATAAHSGTTPPHRDGGGASGAQRAAAKQRLDDLMYRLGDEANALRTRLYAAASATNGTHGGSPRCEPKSRDRPWARQPPKAPRDSQSSHAATATATAASAATPPNCRKGTTAATTPHQQRPQPYRSHHVDGSVPSVASPRSPHLNSPPPPAAVDTAIAAVEKMFKGATLRLLASVVAMEREARRALEREWMTDMVACSLMEAESQLRCWLLDSEHAEWATLMCSPLNTSALRSISSK